VTSSRWKKLIICWLAAAFIVWSAPEALKPLRARAQQAALRGDENPASRTYDGGGVNIHLIVSASLDLAQPRATNSSTARWILGINITETKDPKTQAPIRSASSNGELLYDDGSGAGEIQLLPAKDGRSINVSAPIQLADFSLSPGTYVWVAANKAWVPLNSWEQNWHNVRPLQTFRNVTIVSTPGQRTMSLVGLAVLIGICFAFSNNRSAIPWKLVGMGIGLQVFFGLVMVHTAFGQAVFEGVKNIVDILLGYSNKGASLLFGDLTNFGFAGAGFGFSVLPTIIFFSSFMTVLYHLGVMQWIVKLIAVAMVKTMGTSGAETLSAAGNIFVGQTEAPLLIKPFVKDMTESELMAVMTGGFATVAGGVMAAYVGMLRPYFPDIAGHLLTASVMSAPAALLCAKIMVPEPDPKKSRTYGKLEMKATDTLDANVIDAAARGASEGLTLALNVGAMLLAFTALVYLLDDLLGWLCHLTAIDSALKFADSERVSLAWLLGKILSPIAFLMGVDWADAEKVGTLLGQKTVLNEFFAYAELANHCSKNPDYITPRSFLICTYALCGFANFASIAIQVGGISTISPERRSDLARLGPARHDRRHHRRLHDRHRRRNDRMKSDEDLIKAALEARQRAYAPYSRFKVGAALETASGLLFLGVNVENASYGLTICAERSAIAAAVSAGHRDFKAIAVVAETTAPVSPCGACRQVLAEFGPNIRVIQAKLDGSARISTSGELLPASFNPADLPANLGS
jgi:CNT family concentrative nucleoside transporter